MNARRALARHAGLAARQRLQLLVQDWRSTRDASPSEWPRPALPSSRRDRRASRARIDVEPARVPGAAPIHPSSVWPSATPTLRSTVESVRSRCQRDIGSFSARCRSSGIARGPRLPSEFSKSIGLTLCGIVDEPTSPSAHPLPEIAERRCSPRRRGRGRSGSCWRARARRTARRCSRAARSASCSGLNSSPSARRAVRASRSQSTSG